MSNQQIKKEESNNEDVKKRKKNNSFNGIIYLSQVAFTMVASVFVGVFLGNFLDELFGTSPWLILIFSFLGIGAAIKSIFNISKDKE